MDQIGNVFPFEFPTARSILAIVSGFLWRRKWSQSESVVQWDRSLWAKTLRQHNNCPDLKTQGHSLALSWKYKAPVLTYWSHSLYFLSRVKKYWNTSNAIWTIAQLLWPLPILNSEDWTSSNCVSEPQILDVPQFLVEEHLCHRISIV